MSRENVETFRALLNAVGGDAEDLIALADPEVEWHSFFAALLPTGEYHGHDGLREYVRDVDEAWENIRPEADDVLDAGEVVIGVGRVHYRGKESGVESEAPAGWMVKFRKGKVLRFRAFRDPYEVLEAVGLRE